MVNQHRDDLPDILQDEQGDHEVPADDQVAIDTIWQVHALVVEWVKHSDAKAGVVLAADAMIVAAAAAVVVDQHSFITGHRIIYVAFSLSVLCAITSAMSAAACIVPRLKNTASNSLLYFRHIAEGYNNAHSYQHAVCEKLKDKKEVLSQICHQVWANSVVARRKYISVAWAIYLLMASLALAIFAIGAVIK